MGKTTCNSVLNECDLILMQIWTCVGSGLARTEKGHSVIQSRQRLSYREQPQSWQLWPFCWTHFFKYVCSGLCAQKKSGTCCDCNLRGTLASSNGHLDTEWMNIWNERMRNCVYLNVCEQTAKSLYILQNWIWRRLPNNTVYSVFKSVWMCMDAIYFALCI